MIRSPSQWPGTARSAASAGRWLMMTMSGIRPRRSPTVRRPGGWPGRSAGVWPARGAARLGPGRRAPCRSSRGSPASPGRRETPAAAGRDLLGRMLLLQPILHLPPQPRVAASLVGLGRRPRMSARDCAFEAVYRPRYPLLRASSRLTVDGDRPSARRSPAPPARPAASPRSDTAPQLQPDRALTQKWTHTTRFGQPPHHQLVRHAERLPGRPVTARPASQLPKLPLHTPRHKRTHHTPLRSGCCPHCLTPRAQQRAWSAHPGRGWPSIPTRGSAPSAISKVSRGMENS